MIKSLKHQLDDERADYIAAKSSRFRRQRTGLKGSGDDHYRIESHYFDIIEFVRDMDRNDAIVGSILNRATDNIMQQGFTLDARTGDPDVDDNIEARWKEWSENPEQCDSQGEMTFKDIEWQICRAAFADGDQTAGCLDNGTLELIEADRLRTARSVRNNRRKNSQIIHGIEIDSRRRRLKFHFTKEQSRFRPSRLGDMRTWNVRNSDGVRQVFQVYDPKRVTQTRGISALVPVFDLLGMFEDLQFAKVVQAQLVSCFSIFLETEPGSTSQDVQIGERTESTRGDGSTQIEEKMTPGQLRRLPAGMKANAFSPNIPNAEFFPHVRLILQLIGLNLGLPLIEVLMDGSETNFSGWRGAVNEAQRGFRRIQAKRSRQFHSPVFRCKLHEWIEQDAALKAALERDGTNVFNHVFHTPTWPYIEPSKDAKANTERIASKQTSQRRLHAELGQDWGDVSTEIAEDNSALIIKAMEKAKQINETLEEGDERITWRDVLAVGTVKAGVSVSRQSNQQEIEDGN